MAEFVFPARKHLEELCTNGLFLDLGNVPEPLKIEYQFLRNQTRSLRLPAAQAALSDLASFCIHFPKALLYAYARGRFSASQLSPLFAFINQPQPLVQAWKSFLDPQDEPAASALLAAFEDALKCFGEGSGFWEWNNRPHADCVTELFNSDAASAFITQVGFLNRHLQRLLPLYTRIKMTLDHGQLRWQLGDQLFRGEPFIQFVDQDFCLMESIDPATRKFFCRFQSTHRLELLPADLPMDQPQSGPDRTPQLLNRLQSLENAAEFLRPVFLDRWLSRSLSSLSRKKKGYVILEAPEGMGKTIWSLMLDPTSPYYHGKLEFSSYEVLRYGVSLYPDTQRPSFFIRALNELAPDVEPMEFTEDLSDLRTRLISFLYRLANARRPKRLLLILDGMQHTPYRQGELCLHELLPSPEHLPDGLFILLTDHPEERAHHYHMAEKDPHAVFGTFSLKDKEYQHHLRWYITQYVLHLPSEDDERVLMLAEAMDGSMAMVRLFRGIYLLCAPAQHLSMLEFLHQYPTLQSMLQLWLDQLRDLYTASFMKDLEGMLTLFSVAPHPLSVPDLLQGAFDQPASLWMILRCLHPLLIFTDPNHLAFSSARFQYLFLNLLGSRWHEEVVRRLRFTQARLSNADFSEPAFQESLLNVLKDLDYYASASGNREPADLMSALAFSLLPLIQQSQNLPDSVIAFFHWIEEAYPTSASSSSIRSSLRPVELEAFSLSSKLSDRRFAWEQWKKLAGSPLYDAKAQERARQRYAQLLQSCDPLSRDTIETLCQLRLEAKDSENADFLLHLDQLGRGRLQEALTDPLLFEDPDNTADPCNVAYVCKSVEDTLRMIQEVLQNWPVAEDFTQWNRSGQILNEIRAFKSVLQQSMVESCLYTDFLETYCCALLPVLCHKEVLSQAGKLWKKITDYLKSLYDLRQELKNVISQTQFYPDPEDTFPSVLYQPDPMEAERAHLLEISPRRFIQSFNQKQILAFFTGNVTLWKSEEAMIRLESLSISEDAYRNFDEHNLPDRIDRLPLEEALGLADRWYDYTVLQLCSGRTAFTSRSADDLSGVELSRAHLALTIGDADRLHESLVHLLFLVYYGDISPKRQTEIVVYLNDFLTADTQMEFDSPKELFSLYRGFSSKLNQCSSVVSKKQIRMLQDNLAKGYPGCLHSHHFYDEVCQMELKDLLSPLRPQKITELSELPSDPVDRIALFLAWKAQPNRSLLSEEDLWKAAEAMIQQLLHSDPDHQEDDLLLFLLSHARELGSRIGRSSLLSHRFLEAPAGQELFKIHLCDRNRTLLYQLTASSYLSSSENRTASQILTLVEEQEEDPLAIAFTDLCLALETGKSDLPFAQCFIDRGLEVLSLLSPADSAAGRIRSELLKLQVLITALDETQNIVTLEEKTALWVSETLRAGLPLVLPFHDYASLWKSPRKHWIHPGFIKGFST